MTGNDQMNNKINKIIHLMQTDDSHDAPQDAVKWSKNLFKSRISESQPGLVQRIVAVLREELTPGSAAFGERSAGGGPVRQMLYDAGEISVDLRTSESGTGFDVRGQILGEGIEKAVIKLGGEEIELDSFGGFRFEGIDAGVHEIVILVSDKEIVIEEVNIG